MRFQNATAVPPTGYLADWGQAYDTRTGTTQLRDGMRVRVDGNAGTVEVHGAVAFAGHDHVETLRLEQPLEAAGDIGRHFPDTDERFRGADSVVLLVEAVRRAAEGGWRIVNIDSTIVAQAPKLAPHIDAMRARIAEAIGHPERTETVLEDPGVADELADRGWALQVNGTSLLGLHGISYATRRAPSIAADRGSRASRRSTRRRRTRRTSVAAPTTCST